MEYIVLNKSNQFLCQKNKAKQNVNLQFTISQFERKFFLVMHYI